MCYGSVALYECLYLGNLKIQMQKKLSLIEDFLLHQQADFL